MERGVPRSPGCLLALSPLCFRVYSHAGRCWFSEGLSCSICIVPAPHIPSVLYMDGLCVARFAISFLYLVEVNVYVVTQRR